LHATPHVAPSQVAAPLVGIWHGVQEAPQEAVLALAAQALPHT
jgi:hypothetical protein